MPLSLHWPAAKTRRGRAPLQEDSPAELTELTCGDMALSPSFLGLLVELKSTLPVSSSQNFGLWSKGTGSGTSIEGGSSAV